jgi:hypothetical protein
MAGISAVSGGTGLYPAQIKKDPGGTTQQASAAPSSKPAQEASAPAGGAPASRAASGEAALSAQLQGQQDASRVDTSAVDGSAAAADTGAAAATTDAAAPAGTDDTAATSAAASTATTASASKTYDAEDKNEDGAVTEQERADYKQTSAYINKHGDSGAHAKAAVAVDAYAQGAAAFAGPQPAIATEA